jgi:hypothetical protein
LQSGRLDLALEFSHSFGETIVGGRSERSGSGKVDFLRLKIGPLVFDFLVDALDDFLHFFPHFGRELFFGVSGMVVLFYVFDDEVFGELVDVAASAKDNAMGLLGLLEEVLLLLIEGVGVVNLGGGGFEVVFFLRVL